MRMLKTGLFIILLISVSLASAQYFNSGQDPASIRWRQLNTKNFQLIYPDFFEKQAQIMGRKLELVYNYGGSTLNYFPKKIPIVFHTQSLQSNGLLGWAPRRIEMFTYPSQSMYAQDWLEQLAIHEFRHAVQVGKISQNLPKIIPLLTGQQGAAMVTGLYLPFWFIEGDAVVTETALSNSGRGRLPSFLMETQAQVVQRGKYSFEKAYLGSYKNFVPDHYRLGYYLVGGARNLFGPDMWEKVVTNVGKKPFSLSPVNKALKKQIGLNQRKIYSTVFDSLRAVWLNEDINRNSENVNQITKPGKVYTNYTYHYFMGNDNLIAYKTALNSVPQFVIIEPDGKEKKITIPGDIFDESVDATDNFLTWSELVPNVRWEHSGRSLIHILNIETMEETILRSEFRGVSPTISPDGKYIALVETDFGNNNFISVYDIFSNKRLFHYQTPENNYFFTPRWINGDRLLIIVLTKKCKRFASINISNSTIEYLTYESLGEILNPVVFGSNIYFICGYTGKNDLYVLNSESMGINRVFSSRFGVDHPAISPDGRKMVLSDYTADGYRLIEIQLDGRQLEKLENIKKGEFKLAKVISSQEKGEIDFSIKDTMELNSVNYKKAENLFNFHSWMPAYFSPESYEIQPGISVFSQNLLGTAETSFGYKWDRTEKTGQIYGTYIFKGWFPILSSEVTYGKHATEYISITNYTNKLNEIVRSDTVNKKLVWNEATLSFDAFLPVNLSKGKYYRFFRPELKYEFTSRAVNGLKPNWFVAGDINSLTYRIYYYQILRKSYQDLVPNFGFALDFVYRFSPNSKPNLGNLACMQMLNYFPGFLPNHGFILYSGFQRRISNSLYSFTDIIRYPRGWGKMANDNAYCLSVDYKLPLLYPDMNIGKLFFLKRLKASVYYDYGFFKGNSFYHGEYLGKFSKSISSIGCEFTGDCNFLRIYAPANIGIRFGYLPEINRMNYEFLLSINFKSF